MPRTHFRCTLPPKQLFFLLFAARSAPHPVSHSAALLVVRSFHSAPAPATARLHFLHSLRTSPPPSFRSHLGSLVTVRTMVNKRASTTAPRTSSRAAAGAKASTSKADAEDSPSMDVDAPASKRQKAKHSPEKDEDEDDGAEEDEKETTKKESSDKKAAVKPALTKKGSVTKAPLRAASFTNTSMPETLDLPKAPEGSIKITSWNVSGLNASLKKGFKTYIKAEDADVICLQEHKVNQPLMNLVDPKVYPFSWWGIEKVKGYAGVVVFSKTTPIKVTAGLPTHPDPESTKGRIVTLEYPTCFVLGCYVPNAGQGLIRLKERMVWDVAMKEWLLQIKAKGKHIIWTGDLNVCHKPIDLRNPATNTRSAGFTDEERGGFSAILDEVDLVDTFRELQGEGDDAAGQYSYFSYRFQCRVKGIGWRLDYFVTDNELFKERVVESVIREECYGASDHVPVVLVLKGAL